MKKLLLAAFALFSMMTTNAQDKSSITGGNEEITWLGLDFSQLKFIGNAAQWQDAGEITTAQLVERYFPGWNQLFVTEQERYDVAGALKRGEVKYAIDVTDKANNKLGKKTFFTDDPGMFTRLTEADIKKVVSGYSFNGKSGIGLMMVVESMSKGKEAASIWVTFVNMNNKTVILTKQVTAKAGGFGFRNYWAKTFLNALKTMKTDLKKW